MTFKLSKENLAEGCKKALVAGFAAAAFMGASLMLAASPAHAATTLTVNTASDLSDINPGDGVCDVDAAIGNACTLRAAIEESNENPAFPEFINFNIPGSGVNTISPTSALPEITDTVTIDGYTQPGASPNTLAKGTNAVLKIQLSGTNAGTVDGLRIASGGGDSEVRGLAINRFGSDGVAVLDDSDFNTIEGNFIGTDPSGTLDRGNGEDGVVIFNGSDTTIGGNSPAARNLVSGNGSHGVNILGGSTSKVEGNLIGTKKDGITALGNTFNGLNIFVAPNNTVSGNTVAFNGLNGVRIAEAAFDPNSANGNVVLGNSIFSNTGLGIDLNGDGVTPNDPGDADSGPNALQNFPILASAKTSKKGAIVKGTLNSTPNTAFLIQFFVNPSGEDEGNTFVGQTGVTTDSSGDASFTFKPAQKVSKGQVVTATATDGGNTSEFSAPKKVGSKK